MDRMRDTWQAMSDPAASSSAPPSFQAAPLRPTFRFLTADPAHLIALGFGAGLSRFAPGTVGTLWAWAAFAVLDRFMDTRQLGWLIALSLPIGWWACSVTARHMRVTDPGAIVWDEVVAFWLVLWLVTPAGLLAQTLAFVLFRYFDAAKPGPVAWADGCMKEPPGSPPRWWRAGFGILLDDLVAAFCTLLVIALWRRLFF